MGRRRRPRALPGLIFVAAGAVIILSMILPVKFWWFLLGVALIGLGIYLMRC